MCQSYWSKYYVPYIPVNYHIILILKILEKVQIPKIKIKFATNLEKFATNLEKFTKLLNA
jgi:hypothetical protein